MQVTNQMITRGVTSVARNLGVTYVHLWHVLAGKCESVALVLKVNRECPSLFSSAICKIDWRKIVKENKDKYVWDPAARKYRAVRALKRKGVM